MQSVQITDMVFFKHKYTTMPTVSKADAIVATKTNLAKYYMVNLNKTLGKKALNNSNN